MATFTSTDRAAAEGIAWVFPGQGAQRVGMGRDLYETFPAARAIFREVDAALRFPLSELCFYGPEEDLKQTVNAQPAIMTVSLACLAAAREAGSIPERPTFVAGHSLGEYSALVATGALDLRDAAVLVRQRGRLMQEAGQRRPGTMAAIIGLDEWQVEEVCREAGAEICNINSPNQIVIGGWREAVLRAMDMARARGARRVIQLNVSGAFHSSLMEPATAAMAEVLSAFTFRHPRVPIIANCTGQPLTTDEAIRQELLQQVCRPVQWLRSVQYLLEAGVSTFIEIGPGRVLAGLIRSVAPNTEIRNIEDVASIQGMRTE